MFERALERAAQFNITGVTYRLTQGHVRFARSLERTAFALSGVNETPIFAGVVKRIIPAVASTNAVIAGMKLYPNYCTLIL